mgnify:CR=1 FL=1
MTNMNKLPTTPEEFTHFVLTYGSSSEQFWNVWVSENTDDEEPGQFQQFFDIGQELLNWVIYVRDNLPDQYQEVKAGPNYYHTYIAGVLIAKESFRSA